jgi:hypothetical protein
MAGVLTFKQFIGGADNLILRQGFPSDSTNLIYNYGQDITSWLFEADYQTLVVDTITYDRFTGEPSFTNSKVIGSFAKAEITDPALAPAITNAASGLARVTLPAGMYTGPLVPDARKNVPITVVGVTWTTDDTPTQTNTHRWAIVQSWEPDVVVGDPTTDAGYTAFNLT